MSEEIPAPTSSHRFFKASEYVYDGAREHFIEIFGQPKNGTREPFPRYASNRTPKDSEGYAYVALLNRECEWEETAELIQDLLDADLIEEIDESEYISVLNSQSDPQ